MAAVMPPQPVSALREDQLMDTRTPSPVQRSSNDMKSALGDDYQPDLSNEVSMLSTKLINAINYQTNLDDSLQHTRHELENAQVELKRVSAEKKSLDDAITQGVLVKKSEVDRTINELRRELAHERAGREAAEKAKKQTEGEVESLTSALFEEANTMVSSARKDAEVFERKNSQLKSQLNDTELLLASQQEQLQDLKGTMEKLERTSSEAREPSTPSTPIQASSNVLDAMQLSPSAAAAVDTPPDHPLHFSHILLPMLRTDTAAYTDFAELLTAARKGAPHSRNASGNYASASQTNLSATTTATNSSSPSLPGAFSFTSSSAGNSPQSATFASSAPPLKETKFFKRILLEDLEPTLRLDLAPGLSFLSRRTVLSSLLGGSLVVEPFLAHNKYYGPVFGCALCGESRKNEPYVRKHRFRTSESEDAQRYPLCDYCLGRIRAAGDFVGFLRMLRDGHWRCESEDDQKGAWEEAVKLRERMFWARLGGGVVPLLAKQGSPAVGVGTPSTTAALKSNRPSLESIPEKSRGAERESEDERNTLQSRTPEDVFQEIVSEPSLDVTTGASQQSSQESLVASKDAELTASTPLSDDQAQQIEAQPEGSEGPEGPAMTTPESENAAAVQDSQAEASTQLQQEASAAASTAQAKRASLSDSKRASAASIPLWQMPVAATSSEERKRLFRPASISSPSIDISSRVETPSSPPPPSSVSSPIPAAAPATATATAEVDDRRSLEVRPDADRRPSGVLARVRAMEAKAKGRGDVEVKKMPGGFD